MPYKELGSRGVLRLALSCWKNGPVEVLEQAPKLVPEMDANGCRMAA